MSDFDSTMGQFSETIAINIPYSSSTIIDDIVSKTIEHMNSNHYPKVFQPRSIHIEKRISNETHYWHEQERFYTYETQKWQKFLKLSLTTYNKTDLITKAIDMELRNQRIHAIDNNYITCKYLKDRLEELSEYNASCNIDPMQCPIYKSMKCDYQFTENNLHHLLQFEHFKTSESKPSCKYGKDCNSFIRLQNNENRLDDKCHIQIYRHPPRTDRQLKLS
eukprot:214996_1